MCGRYTRKAAAKVIYEHFGIDPDEEFTDIRIEPSFEISPGSIQPVVRLNRDGLRSLTPMRWGFKLKIQNRDRLVFNTKSETVMESGLWRKRFVESRCIVPASAFIEWERVGAKPGPKHEITVKDHELFGFAGLWGIWTNPKSGEVEKTFSIFTTEPNGKMQAIHNRQPVILDPGEYEEWLTPGERPPLHLLRIFPEEKMAIMPVSVMPPTLFG